MTSNQLFVVCLRRSWLRRGAQGLLRHGQRLLHLLFDKGGQHVLVRAELHRLVRPIRRSLIHFQLNQLLFVAIKKEVFWVWKLRGAGWEVWRRRRRIIVRGQIVVAARVAAELRGVRAARVAEPARVVTRSGRRFDAGLLGLDLGAANLLGSLQHFKFSLLFLGL